MNTNAPTLQEIIQLTSQELTTAQKSDPIRECGRAALSLLPTDPDLCLKLAYQNLHSVPYREVKTCWRRLYTDASLWKVVWLAKEPAFEDARQEEDKTGKEWMDEVVRMLDMALILSGAPGREELVELWFSALKASLQSIDYTERELDIDIEPSERPTKRRKLASSSPTPRIPSTFLASLPEPALSLRYPVPRARELGLSTFQKRVADPVMHTPLIIEGAIQHWPAFEERPWNSPGYLLEQTLGGRRLVPVEVGKSYTDEGWGQKIITFRDFMNMYMLEDGTTKQEEQVQQVGYLAQHDLFAQIPSLRADISIPDYCYCDPAPSPHLTHIKPTSKLDEPLLNAWFGPADTTSPMHTDPYHNILAQVVGYKYVRLYAPEETQKLYPRRVDENGVDMSNTSQIDLDEAMKIYPGISCLEKSGAKDADERIGEFERLFPDFRHARYVEGVLGPGECLYLPVGWWHYVRSLTPSFSVSFWFN
ncbi:jumonji domain-containing 5 [Cucurbitaria berberidis CBS 394.84]|uniref:Jumonji domain-containing 5 n=1 Tax=Cucurbitaria berberidis CBS 394.84 TaxID=1168544 RepID=A0A9P4GFL2_9PLEO|nr:jumonji domain-containing 5 [Cucurbitaria berberidis CBS 394.84]KAF1845163.1 jumonji domain-containing 5 [Cucurbitaria berberidis CBS 394.84]